MILRFEEPPPSNGKGRIAWPPVADELRANPEDWAVVAICTRRAAASGKAQMIKSGAVPAFRPKGSFEATYRSVEDEFRVYARYVGNRDGLS